MPVKLLTVPQVAETCELHVRTINKLIASGELPSVKIGKSRRIPESSLREFIADKLAVKA